MKERWPKMGVAEGRCFDLKQTLSKSNSDTEKLDLVCQFEM